ncbi:MAG: glycosyltransferase [Candidatus Micrarchaeota archaeon]
MRIVFFTDTYLPNKDGVVTSMITAKTQLEKLGHEVYIFCSGSRKSKKENMDERVFYHTSVPFKPYPDYRIAIFPFLSETNVKKLKPDIIHCHGLATMGLAAAWTARRLNIPLVTTFHTLIPEAVHYVAKGKTMRRLTKNMAWGYLHWLLSQSDIVISPSDVIKSVLLEHDIKSEVVPTGINVRRFNVDIDGSGIRKKLMLQDKNVVLHVGRLVKEKNLDVVIKASLMVSEEMPNTKFVVAGMGPALKYYKKLVKDMSVENLFIFKGYLKRDQLAKYYAASDIFAFPSKFETQGLVALEAMACGKPVAGADYLAIKDLIKDGYNGYLFDPDDPEDCAEKIIRTIRERKKMKMTARKTAERYSVELCVKRLIGVYEKACRAI